MVLFSQEDMTFIETVCEINPAREFFTEDAIPFVERIVLLHTEINGS
jgi:hypothetical protein